MPDLRNSALDFSLDPETAHWSLRSRSAAWPALDGVRCGLTARDARGRRLKWEGVPRDGQWAGPVTVGSPHGRLTMLTVRLTPAGLPPAAGRLQMTLEYALPEAHPWLLWRMRIENTGEAPVYLRDLELAVVGARLGFSLQPPASQLSLDAHPGQLAFLSNGYQSWSFTGAMPASVRLPFSRFNWLEGHKLLNPFTPVVNGIGHFTSDMFAVLGDLTHDVGVLAGFLAQREQFGHVEALVVDVRSPFLRLAAQADEVPVLPGAARLTDWAYLQFIRLSAADPLGEYVEAVARENAARVPAHTPVGWCSWYHYYDRVTEAAVLRNLDAIAQLRERLPLDFVQLDDGFQAQVGDWFETKPTFPHGLAWLSEQIRARDCTPGLWLAPYIVRSDAKLNDQHPEWFLRDAGGRRVNAGFNWLRWCFALDPTHPGVRAHVRRLIETAVTEWGFPYLKLDFLYAAALPGRRYDPTLTRAQAMRLALADLRAAAGDETFLLGCGCPLGPAVGVVDGMRISTDVAPNWNPEFLTPAFSSWVEAELGFVSARNAIQNILTREPFHRRWWLNDPDCLLVRDEATRLNEVEVRCLATVIALSSGMFLISDDLTRLNSERYRYITTLLPVLRTPERVRAPDWLAERTPDLLFRPVRSPAGEWLVVGIFHWGALPRSRVVDLAMLGLPPGPYWVANFWENVVIRLEPDEPLRFPNMPAHSAQLVALRPATAGPALVASAFHFSQGGEVTAWEAAPGRLRFQITLGRVAEGEVQLALPRPPRCVEVDSLAVAAVPAGQGLYSLAFAVNGSAWVEVEW